MSSPLAVIFDVDGVLIDSYQPHFRSWQQLFAEMDIEFSEDTFRSTFGRTNRDIFETLYDGELSDERIRELGDRKEALYREQIRQDFPAMPGAVELLEALAGKGYKLAVGSSGPPANIALTLEKMNWQQRIDAQVTADDVERGKPDPQVFQIAAQRLGVSPERCAVVEDAPQGIEAANRAGMTSIGLTGTVDRARLTAADLVVERLDELSPQRIAELIEASAA